jgi:transposase
LTPTRSTNRGLVDLVAVANSGNQAVTPGLDRKLFYCRIGRGPWTMNDWDDTIAAIRDRRGRPVIYPHRDIVHPIRYLDRTGCQWDALPA